MLSLSHDEIEQLAAILATKDDIAALEDATNNIKDEAVRDVIATIEDTFDEVGAEWNAKEAALKARLDEQEQWIRRIADRLDIEL